MSKRTAALASIQSYLADPNGGPAAEAVAQENALLQPHAAPGTKPGQGQPTTKEQREQVALEREQIGLERDQLRLEQEQKSAVEQKTDQAAAKMRQVVNYSKFRLEGLSMPGGLFLPIALLFLFFLALIPIGGQTRLQWLWSVVTGNAELSQMDIAGPIGVDVGPGGPGLVNPGSPGSGPGTSGGTGPVQVVNPAPPPTSGTGLLPFAATFTGVEQPE